MSADPDRPEDDDAEVLVDSVDLDTSDFAQTVGEPVTEADSGAAAMYKAILADDPGDDDAFEGLEAIYRSSGAWPELVEISLARVESLQDVAPRTALLRRIADVYERQLGAPQDAYEALTLAFGLDYADDATAADLERLTAALGKWNDLLGECNRDLQGESDTRRAVALALRLGRWYWEILGHVEYAIPYFGQVLAADPENRAALRLLAAIYRRGSQWDALAQVLERHAPIAPLADKQEILLELGALYVDQLARPDDAWRTYQEILRLDPTHLGAMTFLERMCRATEQWDALVPLLERRAAAVEDAAEGAEIGCQLGEILETRLGLSPKAIDAYRAAAQRDPSCIPAWKGLERLLSAAGKWQEVLGAIDALLGLVETERERAALYVRRAGILEDEFLQPAEAAAALEEVVAIDASNEVALSSLERLYRKLERWPDLVATFERHLRATAVPGDQMVLWIHLGSVLADEMGDVARAVEAYEHALDVDPRQRGALEALSKLYPKIGDHDAALRTMERLGDVAGGAEKVDLAFRQGVELLDHFRDPVGALEKFRAALDANPAHVPSLEKMREILVAREDWAQVAETLEREQALAESPRKRARLLVELGRIEADRLDAQGSALARFEQAIALDADNEEAAIRLADAWVAMERFADAAPLLEGLVRRGSKRDPEEQRRLHSLLSHVQASLGDDTKAWKALEAAYQLDPTHGPTLRGLADLYYRAKDWEGAREFYQTILDQVGVLEPRERVEILHRLGVATAELGDAEAALAVFERALAVDRRHRPTLEAMVGLFQGLSRYDDVVATKRRMMEGADDEARHRILVEIADLWKEVGVVPRAIQAYVEALAVDPNDHVSLHKLLELFTRTKQWAKVVEVVLEIAKLETDPEKLAKYYYTIAAICRDELDRADLAIQYYNEVLDRNPEHAKAFEAIDRILVASEDWKGAERNTRKMLHRIVGQGKEDLERRLWQNLGDLYETRLGELSAAAEALQMAARLDPDDASRHERLAAIYLALPGRHDDAVAEHQKLLAQAPMRIESYQALARIYFQSRQYDKAWCVCAALSFLGRASHEEREFWESYRTQGPVAAQGRLDQERWLVDLFHPNEDPVLGKIFEALTPALRALKVQPAKAYGLRPKDRRDPATDVIVVSKLFGYVAQVLNLPTPHLYVQPDRPGAMAYAITEPPASLVGASLLSGRSVQEIAFVVARHLAYYRGEHYVRWIFTTAPELQTLLLAGIRIGAPNVSLPPDPNVEQTAAALLPAVSSVAREALQLLCRRLVEGGMQIDVKRWLQSIDLTACQAGLLFANDLATAATVIRDDALTVGELSSQEKIKELVLFSVSERYFRLRRALGIDIRE